VEVNRNPIGIKRKPITLLSKLGHSKVGGYYIFNKPKGQEAPRWKIKSSNRILWCPWCGEWRVFIPRTGESDTWFCSVDKWAHTKEFHVSRTNGLMWEGLSVAKVKELSKFAVPRG